MGDAGTNQETLRAGQWEWPEIMRRVNFEIARKIGCEQGQREALQDLILRVGRRKFGEPDEATIAAVRNISDLAHLDRLVNRIFVVTWREFLTTP